MRSRTIAAILLAACLPLAGCGGDDDKKTGKPKDGPSSSFDCNQANVSQAEWMEHCADKAPEPAEPEQSTDLRFGQSYTWPDGLRVTVLDAKKVTALGEYDRTPTKDELGFRVRLKLTNAGKEPAELDDLSVIVEGATNGGQARSTDYDAGSEPLEGRLAPGVTAVKTDDHVLERRYGRDVVVTVQRMSQDFDLDFPEFSGTVAE